MRKLPARPPRVLFFGTIYAGTSPAFSWPEARLKSAGDDGMLRRRAMATLEKRVAYLEGKVEEFVGLREALAQFEQRVDGRFETVDRRFEAIDRRFESMDRRFDAVDDKLSRQFQWLVGIQITTLVAIVGALLARS
jgi:hypothetical protein